MDRTSTIPSVEMQDIPFHENNQDSIILQDLNPCIRKERSDSILMWLLPMIMRTIFLNEFGIRLLN